MQQFRLGLLCLAACLAAACSRDEAFVKTPLKMPRGSLAHPMFVALCQEPVGAAFVGGPFGRSPGWIPMLRGILPGRRGADPPLVALAAKGKGKGGGRKPGMAKKNAGGVRADELMVTRGLADNEKHALLLILRGDVIADEGKIRVDGAGTVFSPSSLPCAVGKHVPVSPATTNLTHQCHARRACAPRGTSFHSWSTAW